MIHAGAERWENEAAWAGQLLAAEVKRLGWPAAELAAPRRFASKKSYYE